MPPAAGGGDVGEHDTGSDHVRHDAGSYHDQQAAEQDTEETEYSQGKQIFIIVLLVEFTNVHCQTYGLGWAFKNIFVLKLLDTK